tara:strand:- start:162 stop:365 length:204 start_codon:yes stop_codon:yes gene_type:complete
MHATVRGQFIRRGDTLSGRRHQEPDAYAVDRLGARSFPKHLPYAREREGLFHRGVPRETPAENPREN